jgi:hypothetical protein
VANRILELTTSRIDLDAGRPIVGIDVGEDFLDLAALEKGWTSLRYARVALKDIEAAPIGAIADRIRAIVPPITADTFAIVDSPRWPRDLSHQDSAATPIRIASPGREIDRALRAVVAPIVGRLSMYPTPELDNFLAAATDPRCKPHIRAIATELWNAGLWNGAGPARYEPPKRGNIFTRFMIVGFALYRALERIGAEAVEGYPDLQFRLCLNGHPLAAKGAGRAAALEARARIIGKLSGKLSRRLSTNLAWKPGHRVASPPTLDSADAAVLALSVAAAVSRGEVIELRSPREGRFVVAMPDFTLDGSSRLDNPQA